ncbi:glycosyltransferase family A protein [Variovorax dokdonensis]|uniref:Glycosyltransferase family A protein n=1 Tax=Variovorax dokdonensis TaxID=344883 RepID=A0ABT7NB38_9BURK|nr:glycosyltransferase family A protein [Variovorax dokdonensis]MDM0045147.1 glycosyltransferase family A protein [Variovorax dokdonensis]
MKRFDVTAVVTAHREGLLLKPALDSVELCVKDAECKGISVQTVISLDRPNELTCSIAERYCNSHSNVSIIFPDAGDLGISRNVAVEAAAGNYVAFLDGDDLWGGNWLSTAFTTAETERRALVLHPEVNVYFGRHNHVFLHVDMEANHFNIAGLAITNYWTSLCFAPKKLLVQCPYPASNLKQQIGFEDWGWNLSVLSAGVIHKVVPGTGHAIRMKRNASLLSETSSAGCMPRSSDFFVKTLQNMSRRPLSRLRIVGT